MSKSNEANVVLNFEANGAIELSKTVKDLNTIMNTAAKEYRAQTAAMGESATATDKLEAQQKKLATQLDAAKKRTGLLSDQLTDMKNSGNASTAELVKMEGKVLDAQRAEASLGNQLSKVNGQLDDSGRAANDAKSNLTTLKAESSQLESEQQKLTSEIKLQNSEMKSGASDSDKLKTAESQLTSQIKLAKQQVGNLAAQLQETKTAYGQNSTEANQMASKLNAAKTKVSDLENELNDLGTASKESGSDMEAMGKKLDASNLMEAGEALSGVADKAKELGGNIVETAADYDNGQSQMQAATGGTKQEVSDLMDVVHQVMAQGVVDDVGEAVTAVSDVKTSFSDLNDTDLSKLTDKITTLATRTGVDYEDVLKSSTQMHKAFGTSGGEATDIIAQGMADGDNRAGDLLDTLDEYSPTFKDAGISSKGMLNVLTSGMKAGAFNTDKVADAVKEFNLRLQSGQYDQVMGKFSQSTQDVFAKFKDGKATAKDVMESVGKDLKGMPADEAKNKVQLLGTQFEDLGQGPSAALLQAAGGVEKVDGAAQKATKHTASEQLTGAVNKLKGSFADILTSLTPVVTGIANFASKLGDAPGPVKLLVLAIGGIITALTAIAPMVISIQGIIAALTPLLGAISVPLLPLVGIIAGVAAAITAAIVIFKNWGSITSWLKGAWAGFKEWVGNFWDGVKKVFSDAINGTIGFLKKWGPDILAVLGGPFAMIIKFVVDHWDTIKKKTSEIFNGVVKVAGDIWGKVKDSVVGFAKGILDGVGDKWNSVKTAAGNAWDSVKTTAGTKWKAVSSAVVEKAKSIYDGLNTKWKDIKGKAGDAWDSVKKTASDKWKTVSTAVVNVAKSMYDSLNTKWKDVKGKASDAWDAVKTTASTKWNTIKKTVGDIAGKFGSTIKDKWSNLKSVATTAFTTVHTAATNVMGKVKDAFSRGLDAVKGFFSRLKLKLPHIDLPHFSLSGSFSLKPPSVPHLNVDWYANGGIFTQPTVFNTAGGGLRGFGDGPEPEAALPLNAETLGQIGKGIADAMGGSSGQPIILNIDGRTFAQIAGPYMSDYMKQQDATANFSYGRGRI